MFWLLMCVTRSIALRIAAIMNHQGPPIPARVFSKSNNHHVIAGPFDDIGEAKDAVKRLKMTWN